MNGIVQNALALVIACAAVGYIGQRVWRLFTHKQSTGCGHCAGGCKKTSGPAQSNGLVALEVKRPDEKQLK